MCACLWHTDFVFAFFSLSPSSGFISRQKSFLTYIATDWIASFSATKTATKEKLDLGNYNLIFVFYIWWHKRRMEGTIGTRGFLITWFYPWYMAGYWFERVRRLKRERERERKALVLTTGIEHPGGETSWTREPEEDEKHSKYLDLVVIQRQHTERPSFVVCLTHLQTSWTGERLVRREAQRFFKQRCQKIHSPTASNE